MNFSHARCFLLFFALWAVSCNAPRGEGQDAGDSSGDAYYSEVSDDGDGSGDSSDEDSCLPHCGDEYDYQQRCWKTEMFFCTPDGNLPGGDPSIYQQAVIIDKCDAEGNPCVPEYPDDPNCRWEIIHLGECEDWLECDPSDPEQFIQEAMPCQGVDENGDEYYGVQDILCQKGQLIAGPCEPCGEEICDAIDNDCDGDVDEGLYPCSSECGEGEAICVEGELFLCSAPQPEEEVCDYADNDCDGDVDEGQRNACDECGDVPADICNGIDDNCNGVIDEDLIQACETPCEAGFQNCVGGQWGPCSAQAPLEEVCNGFDDDCNELVDDGLMCECSPEDIGTLFPCMEPPLVCGSGYKTCECVNPECSQTAMTECKAACYYIPQQQGVCDEVLGVVMPESCNNWDDNCNQLIDEDLVASCYSGPEGTANVGICMPGDVVCVSGQWGSYLDQEQQTDFIPDLCYGEILPLPEDICNGADDNCDGIIEENMEPTDIVFVIDGSGSMSDSIDAVIGALLQFAANYSDAEVIQWGLVVGPMDGEQLVAVQNLSPFVQFMQSLINLPPAVGNSGMSEMLYDALYLVIHNLVEAGDLPHQPADLAWEPGVGGSVPPIPQFQFNWRDDAHHVVVVFTDEPGQSYTNPDVTQQNILDVLALIEDVNVYTFTTQAVMDNSIFSDNGWLPLAINGGWYALSNDQDDMYTNLTEVIDETVCGE